MKQALVLSSVLLSLSLFLCGCSEQKAEKDYKRILDAELTGAEPKTLITQYQSLIDQYPDTGSATRARERVIALKTKIEGDAKAVARKAEREETERKLKAEQDEKERMLKVEQADNERAQKKKERENLETELKRQMPLLFKEMAKKAMDTALSLHPDTEVTGGTPSGEPKGTEDWDNNVWTVKITQTIRLQGKLLGINKFSEVVESTGVIRLNSVTKQFERTASAKAL